MVGHSLTFDDYRLACLKDHLLGHVQRTHAENVKSRPVPIANVYLATRIPKSIRTLSPSMKPKSQDVRTSLYQVLAKGTAFCAATPGLRRESVGAIAGFETISAKSAQIASSGQRVVREDLSGYRQETSRERTSPHARSINIPDTSPPTPHTREPCVRCRREFPRRSPDRRSQSRGHLYLPMASHQNSL